MEKMSWLFVVAVVVFACLAVVLFVVDGPLPSSGSIPVASGIACK